MENDDPEFVEPLHEAIRNQDAPTLKALLHAGHDPNARDYNGLVPLSTLAHSFGGIEIARQLLLAGADPNGAHSCLPPLVQAAAKGQITLTVLLLESGADPNILDEDDYSALMYSLIRKDCDLANTLLSFGADPRFVNREGKDARMYADEAECEAIVMRIDSLLNRSK